jgi:hypothetical protein
MRIPRFNLKKAIWTLLLFYSFNNSLKAQVNNIYAQTDQVSSEIISQCLNNNSLWEGSPLSFNNISTLYILNHGVELDLSSTLEVNNKPVVFINKGDIETLGNPPYFLFHTLDIEESKAFVRIYLSYVSNNETKTSNIEIYFTKNNNHWEISNDQL